MTTASPREFVERSLNVVQWSDYASGGHFTFYEMSAEYLMFESSTVFCRRGAQSIWFLSGGLRRPAERKELVARSRQAEVLAQRRAFVLATKESAPL
ncbi:MAG: hypothetical protein QOI40_5607 [Alphaproteobacteria bacterium]|jgi:hypothetical protein|nr:hypothetical protein [Alphaproteobacteria bacterium]